MKDIYIVGGQGFAQECYLYLSRIAQWGSEINFSGFLSHEHFRADFGDLNKYFVCDLSEFEFGENDYAVIGSGEPLLRKVIYNDIKKKKGAKFYTLASTPDILNSPLLEIGEGNVFFSSCLLTTHVKIGNGNLFNGDIIVGHDVEVGDFNFFGPRSQLLGHVKVGDLNTVGVASVLLPHCKIGNNNKIAPLSAVYKGCKDNCYMLGNPALKVGNTK